MAPHLVTNPTGIVSERRSWAPRLKVSLMAISSKYHSGIYEAIRAMQAPVLARAFYQVCAHPNGRTLFKN